MFLFYLEDVPLIVHFYLVHGVIMNISLNLI